MTDQTPPTDRPLTAGDWITHDGRPMPALGGRVEVKLRSGNCFTGSDLSDARTWLHIWGEGDIIAYRLARPATSAASEGEGIERTIDGETVLGFKVAAWRFDTRCPQDQDKEKWDSFFGKSGPPHTYCEHWSTPGAGASNVERLFTETQLRAALASPPVSERERELEGADREAIERSLRTILAYDAVRLLQSALLDTMKRQHTGYDWNADPDQMTLKQGEALALATKVFADLNAAVAETDKLFHEGWEEALTAQPSGEGK